jgi:protoporphyrinogen oxidase
MNSCVVVGGGISGILSALLLREKCQNVFLIERESRLGGLLSSVHSPQGDSFDFGTHYLIETGHAKIDSLLFPDEWRKDWIPLPYLQAGNFFQGKLNESCMFADMNQLPGEIYRRGLEELLAIKTEASDAGNLEEFLNNTFGKTFTKAVFEPIVVERLGLPLSELYPNGHILIGLNRILIADADTTRRLKSESPVYDRKMGFHSYREGTRPTLSYYPKAGGTSVWIDLLERKLVKTGVTVLKGKTIKAIQQQSGNAMISFEDHSKMNCDAIFWTLPVSAFLKCSGLPTMIDPPKFRNTSHFHYTIDRPPTTDLYYFLCNDASKLSHRVTFYSNIQKELAGETGRYAFSVEVLSGPIADVEEASNRIFRELVEMKAIAGNSKILWKMSRSGVSGIPILTPKFVDQTQKQMQALEGKMGNAYFSGMVPGVSFFKKEVLMQAYDQISRLS